MLKNDCARFSKMDSSYFRSITPRISSGILYKQRDSPPHSAPWTEHEVRIALIKLLCISIPNNQ